MKMFSIKHENRAHLPVTIKAFIFLAPKIRHHLKKSYQRTKTVIKLIVAGQQGNRKNKLYRYVQFRKNHRYDSIQGSVTVKVRFVGTKSQVNRGPKYAKCV